MTMTLTLTEHLDAEPVAVANGLTRAVLVGLDAAASRIDAERQEADIQPTPEGVRVSDGTHVLSGTELRVSGISGLTTLEMMVPWTTADGGGTKYLAANTFVNTVAFEVCSAA